VAADHTGDNEEEYSYFNIYYMMLAQQNLVFFMEIKPDLLFFYPSFTVVHLTSELTKFTDLAGYETPS
jgi:hypothetical protein